MWGAPRLQAHFQGAVGVQGGCTLLGRRRRGGQGTPAGKGSSPGPQKGARRDPDVDTSGYGEEPFLLRARRLNEKDQEETAGPEGEADDLASTSLALPTAAELQDQVAGTTRHLQGLHEVLDQAMDYVYTGDFRRKVQTLGRNKRPWKAEGQPWSSFLSGPHLKVNGIAGLLTRVPLFQAGSGSNAQIPQVHLRPFASAGVSVQTGHFKRNLLDFTCLTARCDLGLTGPEVDACPPSTAPLHPATCLQRQGVWHALSMTFSQQICGPLRFTGDFRFALDSTEPAPGGPRPVREAIRGLATHVKHMRPELVENVYALDLVVPGSKGLARVVAWYSPMRREGTLEFRLC